MKRRMPGILTAGIGLVIIAVALAARLFTVAPAFERMTGDFRPEMRTTELAQLRQDVNGLSAVQAEFTAKVVPQVAAAVGMTPQQFSATMQQQFPAVSGGMQAVPQIAGEFNGVLNVLDNERARFEQADALPTKSVSAKTIPWMLVGAGLLALGVALLLPRRRGGVVAVVLGALLIVGPLVMSLPGKAAAADKMNSHLKPVYTAQLVSGAKQSLAAMNAMGTEMQTKMLPALAQMLKMSPAQVQGYLAANYPTVTAGIGSMPAALARFDRLVTAFDHSLGNYDKVKSTSLVPIVWMLILAGGFIVLIGGWTLARQQETGMAAAKAPPRVPSGVPVSAGHRG